MLTNTPSRWKRLCRFTLGPSWRRRLRRLTNATIALSLCFSVSFQQVHADIELQSWLYNNRVYYSAGFLARALIQARAMLTGVLGLFAGGGGDTGPRPYAPCGAPYPWQASDAATPFSVVNLSNGNLFTAIPMVEVEGLGESLSFALFHNSLVTGLNIPTHPDLPDFAPLPDNWSHSYSRRLDFSGWLIGFPDQGIEVGGAIGETEEYFLTDGGEGGGQQIVVANAVTLITDDGKIIPFAYSTSAHAFVAPQGVKLTLSQNAEEQWVVSDRSGASDYFDKTGLFLFRIDASGHRIDMEYGEFQVVPPGQTEPITIYRLVFVRGDGGTFYDPPRNPPQDPPIFGDETLNGPILRLNYDENLNLSSIQAPARGANDQARRLDVIYDTNGRLEKISSARRNGSGPSAPPQYWVTVGYAAGPYITSIQDYAGNAPYQVTYLPDPDNGIVNTATSPAVFDYVANDNRSFLKTYSWLNGIPMPLVYDYPAEETVVFRGSTVMSSRTDPDYFTYNHDKAGRHWQTLSPEGGEVLAQMTYDTHNNVLTRRGWQDGSTVTMTYDSRDNLLTTTDPLTYVTQMNYDSEDRLTLLVPPGPAGQSIAYRYESPNAPRSASHIDGPGASDTYFEYGEEPTIDHGKPKLMINANGVGQRWDYHANSWECNRKGTFYRSYLGKDLYGTWTPDQDAEKSQTRCDCASGERRCNIHYEACADFSEDALCQFTDDEGEHVCTSMCYRECDDDGNPLVLCAKNAQQTDCAYTPNQFDGNGNAQTVHWRFADGKPLEMLQTSRQFDALGREIVKGVQGRYVGLTPPPGDVWLTNFIYFEPTRGAEIPVCHTIRRDYSDSTGRAKSLYQNGYRAVENEVYTDKAGRVTRVVQAIDSVVVIDATYTYSHLEGMPTMTEQRGNWLSEYYKDRAGRVQQVVHKFGNVEMLAFAYTRDERGRITQVTETRNAFEPGQTTTSYVYGSGHLTPADLDPTNQPDPNKLYWSWLPAAAMQASDPNRLVSETRDGVHRTEYFYDPGGNRLAKRTSNRATANDPWEVDEIVRYNYSKRVFLEPYPSIQCDPPVPCWELKWPQPDRNGEPDPATWHVVGNQYNGDALGGTVAKGRDRLVSTKTYRPGQPNFERWERWVYDMVTGLSPRIKTVQERTIEPGAEGDFVHVRRQSWKYGDRHRRLTQVHMQEWQQDFLYANEEYTSLGPPAQTDGLGEHYAWDSDGNRVARVHSTQLMNGYCYEAVAYDYDGGRALVERKLARDIAVNAYGPTGLIMRTNLDVPIGQPICHRVVLADGQGNTVAAVDPDTGGGTIQHFDAFGVALGTVALTGCRAPLPDRSGTGEYGYRGQEGYRTNLTDVDRPQVQGWREYGDEERSTGLMLLGARDYDPSLGRFVEADPLAVDPGAAMAGQANRWVYCANDPVNLSDPEGRAFQLIAFAVGAGVGIAFGAMMGWDLGRYNSLPNLLDMFLQYLVGLLAAVGIEIGIECWMKNRPTFTSVQSLIAGLGLAFAGGVLAGLATILFSFAIGFLIGFLVAFNLGVIAGSVAQWYHKKYGYYRKRNEMKIPNEQRFFDEITGYYAQTPPMELSLIPVRLSQLTWNRDLAA